MNLSTFNFRVTPVVLAIAIFFLLIESSYRVYHFGFGSIYNFWDYSPRGIVETSLIETDPNPNIAFRLIANKQTWFKAAKVHTNSFGFRSHNATIKKPEGIYRIALLGTSIDMGSGVSEGLNYSSQLQRLFDEVMPHHIEILNFAVGGYKAQQIEAAYWEYVKPFKPDLVLLPVYAATFHNIYHQDPAQIKELLEETCIEIRCLFRDFFSLKLLQSQTRDAFNSLSSVGWFGVKSHWTLELEPPLPGSVSAGIKTEHQINQRFVSNLIAKNINVVVLRLPPPTGKKSKKELKLWRYWRQQVRPSLVINLFPEIQPLISKKDTIFPGDSHPNARVHKLYAESIFESLRPFVEKSISERTTGDN